MHWTVATDRRILLTKGAEMPWKNAIELPGQRRPVQGEDLHSIALEPHYSVPEIASMWHMTAKTMRRLFDGEPGVLNWGTEETVKRRRYQNLRIPESVLIRVHRRRRQSA